MTNDHPNMHPDDMTPEERLDALAETLAEGILHLAENDGSFLRPAEPLLPESQDGKRAINGSGTTSEKRLINAGNEAKLNHAGGDSDDKNDAGSRSAGTVV